MTITGMTRVHTGLRWSLRCWLGFHRWEYVQFKFEDDPHRFYGPDHEFDWHDRCRRCGMIQTIQEWAHPDGVGNGGWVQ